MIIIYRKYIVDSKTLKTDLFTNKRKLVPVFNMQK